MEEKKCSCIVVVYNGSHWIEKMLKSIINSSKKVSIIVVDNASTDDSLQKLASFPEIHLIKSATNLGFGRANNIGMELALEQNTEFIFLLNQDTWVFEKTIENLMRGLEQNPSFGLVSPLHLSSNEIDLDENFKKYYDCDARDCETKKVAFVNAAAWMLTRKCIEKVGFFESIFNHYGEDRNYCNRVLYHKFVAAITNKAVIVHDRTISRNFNKDKIQSKYLILNELLNINNSICKSIFEGLKKCVGLPMYFYKNYNFWTCSLLFKDLTWYYILNILNLDNIIRLREKVKTNRPA